MGLLEALAANANSLTGINLGKLLNIGIHGHLAFVWMARARLKKVTDCLSALLRNTASELVTHGKIG